MSKKQQGFINYYRKPILCLVALGFAALWFFLPPQWTLSLPQDVPSVVPNLVKAAGCLLIVLGILGRVLASLTIASRKDAEVVSTEMYSVVRHPLYFFSFVMVAGMGVLLGRAELFLYLVGTYLLCFYPMMINEERFLEERFGDAYREYKKITPRFIPNWRKWNARKNVLIDMPLVVQTILDAGLALLLLPGVEVVEYVRGLFF